MHVGDLVLDVNGIMKEDVDRQLHEFKNAEEIVVTLQRVCEVPRPTLLYLHGHSGNVSSVATTIHQLVQRLGVNVFSVDYRGYGKSTGKPSEDGLIEDCICAWRWMRAAAEEGRLDRSQLFVYGNQLGGAAALALAAELQKQGDALPQGLILENTFTSVDAWANSLVPTLVRLVIGGPIRIFKSFFLRLKWESLPRIATLGIPLLFVTSKKSFVPAQHSLDLSAAAKAAPFTRHVDSSEKARLYWQEQERFLNDCVANESPAA